MFLNQTFRYALAVLLLLIAGKWAWSHRHDDWFPQWQPLPAAVKPEIEFDNGSVREKVPPKEADPTSSTPTNRVKNEADGEGGQKRLREALDIADGNAQKARLMERVVNQ